jgi:hypothetical protein
MPASGNGMAEGEAEDECEGELEGKDLIMPRLCFKPRHWRLATMLRTRGRVYARSDGSAGDGA